MSDVWDLLYMIYFSHGWGGFAVFCGTFAVVLWVTRDRPPPPR